MNNNKRSIFLGITISCLIVLLGGCKDTKEAPKAKAVPPPDVVSFKKMALYPEGVDYDAKNKRFLVTSMREGVIGEVKDDGTYKVFIKNEHFVSAVGIRIDQARDRLLVCNSDPGASVHTNKKTKGKLAGLGIFQLSTGQLIKYLDLGKQTEGSHFCNDIAIDNTGIAYVTNSFSPIIYKIDPEYNASILLNNKRFTGKGFNLNGIVHRDDFLIVAKMNEGLLFKVPVNDPEKFTQVKLKNPLVGADGLLWASDGSLIVIANGTTNKVFKLTSTDNWNTADVVKSVDTGPVFATTGVEREGNIYVLYAMLHVLFNPETKTHIEQFKIQKQAL